MILQVSSWHLRLEFPRFFDLLCEDDFQIEKKTWPQNTGDGSEIPNNHLLSMNNLMKQWDILNINWWPPPN